MQRLESEGSAPSLNRMSSFNAQGSGPSISGGGRSAAQVRLAKSIHQASRAAYLLISLDCSLLQAHVDSLDLALAARLPAWNVALLQLAN